MEDDVGRRSVMVTGDIGHAAYFFASQEASYITGQTLVIDGGETLIE